MSDQPPSTPTHSSRLPPHQNRIIGTPFRQSSPVNLRNDLRALSRIVAANGADEPSERKASSVIEEARPASFSTSAVTDQLQSMSLTQSNRPAHADNENTTCVFKDTLQTIMTRLTVAGQNAPDLESLRHEPFPELSPPSPSSSRRFSRFSLSNTLASNLSDDEFFAELSDMYHGHTRGSKSRFRTDYASDFEISLSGPDDSDERDPSDEDHYGAPSDDKLREEPELSYNSLSLPSTAESDLIRLGHRMKKTIFSESTPSFDLDLPLRGAGRSMRFRTDYASDFEISVSEADESSSSLQQTDTEDIAEAIGSSTNAVVPSPVSISGPFSAPGSPTTDVYDEADIETIVPDSEYAGAHEAGDLTQRPHTQATSEADPAAVHLNDEIDHPSAPPSPTIAGPVLLPAVSPAETMGTEIGPILPSSFPPAPSYGDSDNDNLPFDSDAELSDASGDGREPPRKVAKPLAPATKDLRLPLGIKIRQRNRGKQVVYEEYDNPSQRFLTKSKVKYLLADIHGLNLTNEALEKVVDVSAAYFGQAVQDLAAYLRHRNGKNLMPKDVVFFMQMQGVLNHDLFYEVSRLLPGEYIDFLERLHVFDDPKFQYK